MGHFTKALKKYYYYTLSNLTSKEATNIYLVSQIAKNVPMIFA